jgi:hypothetical protein
MDHTGGVAELRGPLDVEAAARGVAFTGPADFLDPRVLRSYRDSWNVRPANVVPNLPPFDEALTALLAILGLALLPRRHSGCRRPLDRRRWSPARSRGRLTPASLEATTQNRIGRSQFSDLLLAAAASAPVEARRVLTPPPGFGIRLKEIQIFETR